MVTTGVSLISQFTTFGREEIKLWKRPLEFLCFEQIPANFVVRCNVSFLIGRGNESQQDDRTAGADLRPSRTSSVSIYIYILFFVLSMYRYNLGVRSVRHSDINVTVNFQ